MSLELFILILAAAVQAGTPLLYATIGEIITQRSGVINLGVEGMMIIGAFTGFITLYTTANPWLAFLLSGVGGGCVALLHGVACLNFRSNQIVSGLTLTIFGVGLADFLGNRYIGSLTDGFVPVDFPFLSAIPVFGPVFFQQDVLVYISFMLLPGTWYLLRRTRLGLSLRAAGENPAALAASGISPVRVRWIGILLGGFLVGLGGGYISLAYTHQWTHSITAGRGWIAVALVIFAYWRPGRALLGAYLFGGIWVFQLRLQAMGTVIPSHVLSMLPYVLTLAALLVSSYTRRGRGAPAALGVNIEPEQ